jgi:hypothetical protein
VTFRAINVINLDFAAFVLFPLSRLREKTMASSQDRHRVSSCWLIRGVLAKHQKKTPVKCPRIDDLGPAHTVCVSNPLVSLIPYNKQASFCHLLGFLAGTFGDLVPPSDDLSSSASKPLAIRSGGYRNHVGHVAVLIPTVFFEYSLLLFRKPDAQRLRLFFCRTITEQSQRDGAATNSIGV